jgi:hypothetical protein
MTTRRWTITYQVLDDKSEKTQPIPVETDPGIFPSRSRPFVETHFWFASVYRFVFLACSSNTLVNLCGYKETIKNGILHQCNHRFPIHIMSFFFRGDFHVFFEMLNRIADSQQDAENKAHDERPTIEQIVHRKQNFTKMLRSLLSESILVFFS